MNSTCSMSKDSILRISRLLESHHVIFYKIWDMGIPILSESIPTACVKFDKKGRLISFEFNPKFWDSINDYERAFVIAHECLHVIFNHGARHSSKDQLEQKLANIAMDVAVNEILFSNFQFDINKIKNCPDLCMCDTVFKDKNEPKDRSFEYYFNKLKKQDDGQSLPSTLDLHDFLKDLDQRTIDQIAESIVQDLSVSKAEIEEFFEATKNDSKSQGDDPGNIAGKLSKLVSNQKIHTNKKKWMSLVSDLSKSILKEGLITNEQWILKPRRLSSIETNFFLPFEHEEVYYEHDKFNAWFFLDCSGSCYEYANKFFNATKAIPPEHFNTKLFTFDTAVREIKKTAKNLYGFGGTSFSCIESYIQSEITQNKIKYPDLVFILTDGYGYHVTPQYPKKWIWINTSRENRYIPKDSKIIKYQDLYFD